MIMANEEPCGRGDDQRPFGDVIGEVVQEYLDETPGATPTFRTASRGVSDGYFIGEISFDVVLYRSE